MKWPLVTRATHDFIVRMRDLEVASIEIELDEAQLRIRELHDELSLCRRQKREMVSSLARAAKEIVGLTQERDYWRSHATVTAAGETP
jgi:chromosome segregation ATPase